MRGYASGKEDYLARLRRIEGQVRGLQKMIDADTWCPNVVTQVSSVTRALQEVAVGLLSDDLALCVLAAARGSADDGRARLDEVAPSSARSCGRYDDERHWLRAAPARVGHLLPPAAAAKRIQRPAENAASLMEAALRWLAGHTPRQRGDAAKSLGEGVVLFHQRSGPGRRSTAATASRCG